MALFTFPITVPRTTFRQGTPSSRADVLKCVPFGSTTAGGRLVARRDGGAPLHPGADQTLETFADQAVIAIENVGCFNELKEALEQRDGDERDPGVIASPRRSIQPVLDAIARARRGCAGSSDATIRLV